MDFENKVSMSNEDGQIVLKGSLIQPVKKQRNRGGRRMQDEGMELDVQPDDAIISTSKKRSH